jgi:hypothetical protein
LQARPHAVVVCYELDIIAKLAGKAAGVSVLLGNRELGLCTHVSTRIEALGDNKHLDAGSLAGRAAAGNAHSADHACLL